MACHRCKAASEYLARPFGGSTTDAGRAKARAHLMKHRGGKPRLLGKRGDRMEALMKQHQDRRAGQAKAAMEEE